MIVGLFLERLARLFFKKGPSRLPSPQKTKELRMATVKSQVKVVCFRVFRVFVRSSAFFLRPRSSASTAMLRYCDAAILS